EPRSGDPTTTRSLAIRLALSLLVVVALGPAAALAQDSVPGEVLVRWKPTLKPTARAQALSAVGATRVALYDLTGIELLHVDGVSVAEAVARLSQDPGVEYAEPNYLWSIDRAPDDPRYPEQYGLHNTGQGGGLAGADIGAEGAWDRFTGDPNLLIG